MLKHLPYALMILLAGMLLFSSCRKEKTYWEDDIIAPLAQGSIDLGSMFPDTTIKSNPDSSLTLAFDTELINYGIDSLLKIPDTTISTAFTFTIFPTYTFNPGAILFSSPTSTYYDFPNGILLKYATINTGRVKVELTNTVRQPIDYRYQLLSAKKNNIILDTTFKIPGAVYSGTTLVSAGTNSCYINLAGYDIDFTGTSKNLNNTIDQTGKVSISSNAQYDTLFYGQGLTCNFTFTGMIPQYAQGYFGNQSVTVGPDTTNFDVFNTIQSGMLNLNAATVNLKIVNEFGVSMRATVNSLTAMSTPNATTTVLTSSVLTSAYNINGAINNGQGMPVTASTKTITLNQNNSNITSFIGILPDKFSYKLSTQLNPAGNQGGNNDFAYYGTGFKAYMNADIPLHFSASNIVLLDTMPIDLSGVSQFDNVNRGQLILTATNSYPFSINLQATLLDANKNPIDILFSTPNTIQAPQLDANFIVIAPLQSKLYVPITRDKLNNVKNARYISYSATFNTASQPNQIKFYNYYKLYLLLTADINYTFGK